MKKNIKIDFEKLVIIYYTNMTTLVDNIFNTVCELVDDLIQEYQINAPLVQKIYKPELMSYGGFNNNLVKNNSISEPMQETHL